MSDDDRDDSRKVGLWVVFTTVAVLLLGVIGYAVMRTGKPASAPMSSVVTAASGVDAAASGLVDATVDASASAVGGVGGAIAAAGSAIAAAADNLIDFTVTGAPLATVYFASGAADVNAESKTTLEGTVSALNADAGKKVLVSGYHDDSGDAALNAELAKNRAKAVRAALVDLGVAADRVLLRKPEVTTGGADKQEARRVEIRLVDAP